MLYASGRIGSWERRLRRLHDDDDDSRAVELARRNRAATLPGIFEIQHGGYILEALSKVRRRGRALGFSVIDSDATVCARARRVKEREGAHTEHTETEREIDREREKGGRG